MAKIVEYNVVNANHVDGYLRDGWDVYGSPFVFEDNIRQAMVMYEPETKKLVQRRELQADTPVVALSTGYSIHGKVTKKTFWKKDASSLNWEKIAEEEYDKIAKWLKK